MGSGAVAFVSGDAGIGKTRFLAEFVKRLPRNVTTASSVCAEFAPAPLAPVTRILEALSSAKPGASREAGLETEVEGAPGKLRLFARVAKTLRAAAGVKPVVIVLDDVHWADTATLDLIQYLASDLADERVLLVLGYRSDAVSRKHPLDALVARLERSASVERIELGPLAPAAVGEMIDATLANRPALGAEALRYVRSKSEGNPLFAEELLKAALERGGASTSGPPASLRGLILERLEKLSSEHARLLEIAALIGRRVSASFLERVSDGQSTAAILAFLRVAVDEHFLIEDRAEPGWFTFRHALVRETILAPLLLVELRAMHLRIAAEIENEPDAQARVMELSDHYWQAAEFEKSSAAAVAAADQARSRHAYQEAAEQYERALACATHADRQRAVFHERAANAHVALGNSRAAVDHLESAAMLFDTLDAFEHGIAVRLELAIARRRCGDMAGSSAALERASEIERGHPSGRWRVKILVQMAQLQTLLGDWEASAGTLSSAESLLDFATPRDLVRFYSARAELRFARHLRVESQEDSDESILAARTSEDPTLLAFTLTTSGIKALKIGRLDLALPAFHEAIATGSRFGPLYSIAFARLGYAQTLFLAGRLEEARSQVAEVLAEGHDSLTLAVVTATLAVSLSIVLRDDGLFERSDAAGVLERSFAAQEMRVSTQLAAVMAEKLLADGDIESATKLLRRMLLALPDDELVCEFLIPVAICCDRSEIEMASRHISRTRGGANRYADACAELFAGYRAARFETTDDSTRHALSAAKQFAALDMPLLEAEAYVLARQGTRATVICERVGARRLTRRLPSAVKDGAQTFRLTPREREISDLAMSGLSNKAIATELSLSERTVESHLASAFAKFGVRSRAELLMARR